jgi:hypothetical protein
MHEVHFLTLAVVKGLQGWIAPVEALNESHQTGTYAIPIQASGTFFNHYCLGFVKYLGQGRLLANSSIMELQNSGFFKVQIGGATVRFQIRLSDGNPIIYEYVGGLLHPDFQLPLAEIEPESEQQLDDLYSQERIVVVGCDPASCYGGMNSIE